MDTLSEFLSADNQLLPIDTSSALDLEQTTNKLALNQTNLISSEKNLLALLSANKTQEQSIELISDLDEDLDEQLQETEEELTLSQIGVHPLITEDRTNALALLANVLLSADQIIEQLQKSLEGPVCPYQASLVEYLGTNYKIPSVYELAIPLDFSLVKAISTAEVFTNQMIKNSVEQLDVMCNEATDTSFYGITSQNLGNAFSVLSTTSTGQEYVLRKDKIAQHLEFAEIVRNLPDDYIEDNPYEVAIRLSARYTEIIKDL